MTELSPYLIKIKNINTCSADVRSDAAELECLVADFIFDENLKNQSISDIKSTIEQKFSYLRTELNISKYEIIKQQLNVCRQLPQHVKIDFDIIKKFKFIKVATILYWCYNEYAGNAFFKFSKLFSSCNEKQAESFSDVCENIITDETFGILPLMNSNDGRLMSFYRLIDKYDLKISALYDVENLSGDNITKFALVGKNFISNTIKEYVNFEFSITGDISNIIYITDLVGGSITSVTSIPSLYNKHEAVNYITIRVMLSQVRILLCFFHIFGRSLELIGIYSDI